MTRGQPPTSSPRCCCSTRPRRCSTASTSSTRVAATHPEARAARRFAGSWRWLRATPPTEVAQHYVETFDLRRRCALYLTYYRYGDTRKRGMAMLAFKTAYRDAGFVPPTTSCPTTCRWCSTSPRSSPRGERLLRSAPRRPRTAAPGPASRPGRRTPTSSTPSARQLPRLRPARARPGRARPGRTGPPREEVGLEPFAPPEYLGWPADAAGGMTVNGVAGADLLVGGAALPRARRLRRRPHLAVALRPVRLDQPLHPAAGTPAAQVGRPAVPLRHLRRDRRARHRHPDPGERGPGRSASRRTSTTGSPPSPARWPRCWSSAAWWCWPPGGCSCPGCGPPPPRSTGVALVLLLVIILTGIVPTIVVNLFGSGYDYRTTVAPWFRGLFTGTPTCQRDRARAR